MSVILKEYKAKSVMEGAGVMVNRVFGYDETEAFDPFLMLDYFESKEASESPGFPWHPHKGIETITYLLKGSVNHEDSLGNKGSLKAGEVQWMTAGKGIQHQEMPTSGQRGLQGFQFWLNLPKDEKLVDSSYVYIRAGEMPTTEKNGVMVKVIAGQYDELTGPIIKERLGVKLYHVSMADDAVFEIEKAKDKQGFVFVFEGQLKLNGETVEAITAYTIASGSLQFLSKGQSEFIYAEGIPLKESIVWRGPIVMNTMEEIRETFKALDDGTFGL